MGKGVPFIISVGVYVKTWEAIKDAEWDDISVQGPDAL